MAWGLIGSVPLVFAACSLLLEYAATDRLRLHNATGDPIVFEGSAGSPGSRRVVDIYLAGCETIDLTGGPLGWTTSADQALIPVGGARRIEIPVRIPPDGVGGMNVAVVVTSDGVNEIDRWDPPPTCAA